MAAPARRVGGPNRDPAESIGGMGEVTDFLAGLDPATREAFDRIRRLALEIVPDAEEGVSYSVPALRWRGKPLLGFKAARSHLSVFPFSPAAVDAARHQLAGFQLSKGTIRFSADRPLPDGAVTTLIQTRRDEIAA